MDKIRDDTCIVATDSEFELMYTSEYTNFLTAELVKDPNIPPNHVTTPNDNPIRHASKSLIMEIQTELKIATPNQLMERAWQNKYYLLSNQIDMTFF